MKLLAFPRDANPYQELLYNAVREQGVQVDYLDGVTRSHTLNLLLMPIVLLRKRLQGCNVLHVHWTYPFKLPVGGAFGRLVMEMWTACFWTLTKLYGMRLVWTAHNALPHEPIFLNDRRAHQFLGLSANRIIVHTEAAKQQLLDMRILNPHIRIIPHGSYIGAYPDTCTTEEARQKLQLPARATVFLFFGLIRPYKGVENLLAAFQQLPKKTDAVLVIAGAVQDSSLKAALEAAAADDSRIHLQLRYIADDELQFLFRAASFTVLPYEQTTTSGVSLLACSFASPIIAPHRAAFADIPSAAQMSYDTGTLAGTLRQAATLPRSKRAAKSLAAYTYAQTLSWDKIAAQTIDFIKSKS